MAKKGGPALFELLKEQESREERPLRVPGWWGRREAGDRPVRAPIDDTERAVSPERVQPPAARGATADDPAPWLELDGDRVRISLTSVSAAMVLFALLVLLGFAYAFGRLAGKEVGIKQGYQAGMEAYAASAASDIEAAREQPPATHLISPLLDDPVGSQAGDAGHATVSETGPTWVTGHTYIVAQGFRADHAEDAAEVRAFLRDQGIDTTIVRYPSGDVHLITTQGYNLSDPTQRAMAEQLLERIRSAGAAYYEAGGGYRLDGYFKTLKGDSW